MELTIIKGCANMDEEATMTAAIRIVMAAPTTKKHECGEMVMLKRKCGNG